MGNTCSCSPGTWGIDPLSPGVSPVYRSITALTALLLLNTALQAADKPKPDGDKDPLTAAQRKLLIAEMRAGYPKALADIKAQIKRANGGRITTSVKRTFVPPNGLNQILYPSKEAKEAYIASLEAKIEELNADPTPAALPIKPPIAVGHAGRLPRMYVEEKTRSTAVLWFVTADGNQLGNLPVHVSGIDGTGLTLETICPVPGLFACVSASAGKPARLVPVELTEEEIAEVSKVELTAEKNAKGKAKAK